MNAEWEQWDVQEKTAQANKRRIEGSEPKADPKEQSKSDELKERFKKDFGPKEEFVETEVELCPCEVSRECGVTVMCFACTGKQKYTKRVSFKLALPK